MAKFAYYFSAYRVKKENEEGSQSFKLLADALAKYGTFELVYRYSIPFLRQSRFSSMKKYYLYDHLPKLTQEQVSLLESEYCIPFSTVRMMTVVSRVRYPDTSNLPTDMEFAQIVASWVKFFKEEKLDVFICGLMDDYAGIIGMEVARKMGVKTVVLFSGGVYSGEYLLCDINYLPAFYRKYSKKELDAASIKATEGLTATKVMNATISKVFSKWFDLSAVWHIPSKIGAAIASLYGYYFEIPKIERKMWLSTFELIMRQTKYFIRSQISKLYFKEGPVAGEKFVFFPLHFTDDAAIVTAVPFLDQINAAEELARSIPAGWKLYIKAHPHWKCADLKLRDMGRLRAIPNARLIKYDVGAKDLIRASRYTVVINSTVGYECLALKKKVFTLGNFYPGDAIPHLSNPREIIPLSNHKFDWDKISEFMGNVYLHGIRCPPELFAYGSLNEEIAKQLAASIDEFRKSDMKLGPRVW